MITKNRKHFNEIDSTNCYLMENGSTLDNGYIVTADYQTEGRGRHNHKWEDNGQNIAMSILLKPNIEPSKISLLTQVAAAAVYKTLNEFGIDSEIKWPNDILVGSKKICGILIESKLEQFNVEYIVCGIGINVGIEVFNDELKDKATSMKQVLNHRVDKEEVIEVLIKQFNDFYQSFLNNHDSFLTICREKSSVIGKKVAVTRNSKDFILDVIGIDENGKLIVNDQNCSFTLDLSEVSLEKEY